MQIVEGSRQWWVSASSHKRWVAWSMMGEKIQWNDQYFIHCRVSNCSSRWDGRRERDWEGRTRESSNLSVNLWFNIVLIFVSLVLPFPSVVNLYSLEINSILYLRYCMKTRSFILLSFFEFHWLSNTRETLMLQVANEFKGDRTGLGAAAAAAAAAVAPTKNAIWDLARSRFKEVR